MRLPAVQTADPDRAVLELRAVSAELRRALASGRPLFPDSIPRDPAPLPACDRFAPTPSGQRCASCRVHRTAHTPETR